MIESASPVAINRDKRVVVGSWEEVGWAMLKVSHTQEDKEAVLKKLTRLWISTIFVLTAIGRCSRPTN
ncbi:MAG: hypothetical protein ACYSYU_10850 [Planctomycetota bacterium]|jgi:hypothetical protein